MYVHLPCHLRILHIMLQSGLKYEGNVRDCYDTQSKKYLFQHCPNKFVLVKLAYK
jgi:hypothetical protein